MIGALKKLLGLGPKTDFALLVREGAMIVDVRSPAEFKSGHIRGSINLPVDSLTGSLGKLPDKNRPVITCCASGMRSAAAKNILKSKGYAEVHNGGSWTSLQRLIG
jgi:phage shock protein E